MSQTPHPDSFCDAYLTVGRDVPISYDAFRLLDDQFKVGNAVNWPLLLAELKSGQNQALLNIAAELSESWVTCACGNQCSRLPRRSDNHCPLDSRLSSLGARFYSHLATAAEHGEVGDRITKAEAILEEIEERSDELLKQLH